MRISDWSSDVCSSDLRIRLEFLRHHDVIRQVDDAARGVGGVEDRLGGRGEVVLAQALADIHPARSEEGVGHAAADNEMIDLADKVFEQDRKSTRLNSSH